MSDMEVENKNVKAENQAEVSAPTEIGEPTEGAKKDIRWYVIHTYSGYENKVKDTLTTRTRACRFSAGTIPSVKFCSHWKKRKKKKTGR